MYMKLYDHLLRPITNFNIVWENQRFGDVSRLSQMAYFVSLLDTLAGSWAIISHRIEHPEQLSKKLNDSDLIDGVIINLSDHARMDHFNPHLLNKPYVVLNGDYTQYNYHPFWLVTSHWWAQTDPNEFPLTRKHRVGVRSRALRPARIYVLLQLTKKSYYAELAHWWGIHEDLSVLNDLLPQLEIDQATAMFPVLNNLPAYTNEVNEYDLVGSIQHGIDESYLNIVLETYADSNEPFVSEKIFKPIRGGQLFLVQGAAGSVELLRKLGFDVYDDFINHNHYDHDPDWRRRTDLMLEVLDQIYPNIETIYQQTLARRIANAQYLRSPKLIKRIASLLQITTHRPLV
jgi:hypothetical protein